METRGSMTVLMSTKEVAAYLKVNEKMVYTLIADKNLPATKITGKWMFPRHLVEQWIEVNTSNYPYSTTDSKSNEKLLIITGSNDLLLNASMVLFNHQFSGYTSVFGNLGSMGGIKALQQGHCDIAASHILQEDEQEYNFKVAESELGKSPAIVNFCKREQGILFSKGNPKKINKVADLGKKGIRIVNRSLGTGTRLLLDHELQKAGIDPAKLNGYREEKNNHLDVGLEVLSGRADAGPGIRIVAHLLGLGFIPLRWESFDLLIPKDRFFEKRVQLFLGLLQDKMFKELYPKDCGYDLQISGKVVFPAE